MLIMASTAVTNLIPAVDSRSYSSSHNLRGPKKTKNVKQNNQNLVHTFLCPGCLSNHKQSQKFYTSDPRNPKARQRKSQKNINPCEASLKLSENSNENAFGSESIVTKFVKNDFNAANFAKVKSNSSNFTEPEFGFSQFKSFLMASAASAIIFSSPSSSATALLCPDSMNLGQIAENVCPDSVNLAETTGTGSNLLDTPLTRPDSMNLVQNIKTSPDLSGSSQFGPDSMNPPQIVPKPTLETLTSVKTITAFGPPELASHLESQIWLDLEAQMGSSTKYEEKSSVGLLELAERLAEIDSTLPPDSSLLRYGPLDRANGLKSNGESGDLMVTSFSPSFAISSFSASSAAADIAVAASSAASAIQPAVASTTAGLASRVGAILAAGVQHFAGGGVAGAVGATVVYPLDTVKTKLQAQRKASEEEEEGEVRYKNELDCFLQMVKKEGVGSLYQGLGPQLVGVAPEKAVKLTVNEVILSILETFLPGARIWALELIAGGGGGFSQVVFTNPVEIVKVRLQTQPNDGTPPKNTLQVIKELGIKGLYTGSMVTMARDVPSSAVFFAIYAFLKTVYPEQYFLDGCLAAIPASILVTPMDVVKTRLTMEPAPGVERYKDGWDCAQKIIKYEGVGTLFKGGFSRVLRISPQFGITLMIYDYISSMY